MVTNVFWGFFVDAEIDRLNSALTFWNKLQYRFVNARIKRGTNAFASSENVVEFKKGVCGIYAKKKLDKNWIIPPNISATTGSLPNLQRW